MHLVTNTLPTTQGRALHPCHTYSTLTYQLAATRLREMGVDVPGDGWITDVFLEDVVKKVNEIEAGTVDKADYDEAWSDAERANDLLENADRRAGNVATEIRNLRAKIADGEHYGEGFDLDAELERLLDVVTELRDGMDR